MTDVEMIKLCADAMGFRLLKAYRKGTILYDEGQHDWRGLMYSKDGVGECLFIDSGSYDPLNDDAQAMALVKRFLVSIAFEPDVGRWQAYYATRADTTVAAPDLNRAIVECVAKLQRESS